MKNKRQGIRQAHKNDWSKFHSVDKQLFPDDEMRKTEFEKRVSYNGFFILEDKSGQLDGYLILRRSGKNHGHLGRIGVALAKQKTGLGTKLMQYALNWFKKQGEIQKIVLYTQHDNHSAQTLYSRFNFAITGTTWQYRVPLSQLSPLGKYRCTLIQSDEIDAVEDLFSSALQIGQIQHFLDRDQRIFILRDSEDRIVGVCRFTPEFPGCFPFEIIHLDCFDDFLAGLLPYSLPKYDYTRITFTNNSTLAKLCNKRGFELHHKLFEMTAALTGK
ncbi:MAG: GNAT family N-acetyltransferase [Candidatus Heimdallarchaeota archaeon]